LLFSPFYGGVVLRNAEFGDWPAGMDFTGLSAFPITPADENGRVQTDQLQGFLDRLKTVDVGSICLLGSTGTYAYLSRAERRRAVDAAVEGLAGHVPLIVGVGALRTDDACHLAKDAAASGADALLLAPVSYTPLTQEEAFQHYQTVALATDLPLCIYNNPGTTHFSFSLDLLERLAHVPGITAVKMPLPLQGGISDDLSRLRNALPDNFAIGYSGDWGCAEALLAGADTWFSVVGGLFPEIAAQLTNAARAGNTDEVHLIDARLAPLWDLFKEYGSLRVIYAAARLAGLTTCDAPRPILPLGKEETRRVADATEHLAR
jgi:4-hydroxy-tetrahydrodipicolinate synthase